MNQRYELTPTKSKCPVCTHHAAKLLYRVNSDQAAQHFVTRQADAARNAALSRHIASLWQQASCEVLRCEQCEFCYASPFVGGDQRFYELAFQGHTYPAQKWEFKRCHYELGNLKREFAASDGHSNRRLRVLEIGAGQGLFAELICPSLIAPDQMLCLEYSQAGIKKIQAMGIPARAIDIRDLQPDESFDVVCCFQVLEHLDRLDDLFAHLQRITTPQARLYFSVPNPKRIEFNETNGALLDMPPNHIGRWGRKAFETICERHGWQLALIECEPQDTAGFTKQFATYRVMQRQQTESNWYTGLAGIRSRPLRRIFQTPLFAVELLRSMSLRSALRDPGLGDSLFVELTKSERAV